MKMGRIQLQSMIDAELDMMCNENMLHEAAPGMEHVDAFKNIDMTFLNRVSEAVADELHTEVASFVKRSSARVMKSIADSMNSHGMSDLKVVPSELSGEINELYPDEYSQLEIACTEEVQQAINSFAKDAARIVYELVVGG